MFQQKIASMIIGSFSSDMMKDIIIEVMQMLAGMTDNEIDDKIVDTIAKALKKDEK